MKIGAGIAALLFALACSVDAQTSAEKMSPDLARYYFASPEAEVAARVPFEAALEGLRAHQGKIASGPILLKALQDYEEALRAYYKHEGYLHLRCADDRKDAACGDESRLQAELNSKTAFLKPEIAAIPEQRLQAFLREEPRLPAYQAALEDMRREAGHMLSASEEALLDRLLPEFTDWQYPLYESILAAIPFGTVKTTSGALDVARQRGLLASNSDPRVREEAFRRRFNGLQSQRDLLAFALIHTVKAQDTLAKDHHYADALERKYSSLSLDPQQTRKLLELLATNGGIAKRFENIRVQDFERACHAQAQAWDLSAPDPGFTPPSTPLTALPTLFHNVLAGLGREYQAAFDALLAAENGRADVIPGGAQNRYPGGFSIGFGDAATILFYGRYDRTFKDLSVIAHEGGHAVHRTLMSTNGVKPLYATGPSFLFESFAMFNELILADYMAEHANDPSLQRFYRKQWLAIKGLDAFYGAQDALLEQAIYDGVSTGATTTAGDLDKLTIQIDSRFSAFAATTPEVRNRWAAVSLMYEDPLYHVNYVYGGLLALKYYQLYRKDKEHFLPQYIALLKNGFDAPPAALLKKFLGFDLFDPALLTDDIQLLNERMDQLK